MGELDDAICTAKSELRRIADELSPATVLDHIIHLAETAKNLALASGNVAAPPATANPPQPPAEVLTSPEPGQAPPPP